MFKKAGISSLTAFVLLTLAVPESGRAIRFPTQAEHIAQVAGSRRERERFPLPDQVASDTHIKIDGSPTMVVVNDTLKQQFESDFPDTRVDIAASGTVPALDRLVDGELDLVAVGRPLTRAERDRGMDQLTLEREKIAIIIGPDNPFDGNLTFTQFAQIFRGEITDWSEVGGEPGPIQFVDRPEDSDTRLAFAPYEAFKSAPFVSGPATIRVDNDETKEVIDALGDNGIGYALVSHVLNLDTVKIVPMHKTLPDNPAYPYSQPRAYAYLEPPTEAVKAFLGYGLADPGQTAIALAQDTEGQAIANGLSLMGAVSPSTNADTTDANAGNDLDLGDGPNGDATATTGDDGEASTSADGNDAGNNGDVDSGLGSSGTEANGNAENGDGSATDGQSATNIDGTVNGADATSEDGTGPDGTDPTNGQGSDDGKGGEGSLAQADGSTGASGETNSSGTGTEDASPAPQNGGKQGSAKGGLPMWLWWLLPLGALGLLLWGLLGRKSSEATDSELAADEESSESVGGETASLVGAAAAYGGSDEDTLETHDMGFQSEDSPNGAALGMTAVGADAAPDDEAGLDAETGLDDEADFDSETYGDAIAPEDSAIGTDLGDPSGENLGDSGLGIGAGTAIATGAALVTGLSFLKAGRSQEAQASLDEAIAQNPEDDVAQTLKAQSLAEAGEWDQALDSYDRALAIDPDSPVALAGKGVALTQKGQPEVAIAFYDQALKSHERQTAPSKFLDAGLPLLGGTALTAAILAAKGKALALTKQPSEAMGALNRASNLNPDDADVWTVKGDTFVPLEQTEAALASYDRAIEQRAYSPAAYLGKGQVLSKLPPRFKDALSHYEWATTLTRDAEEERAELQPEGNPPVPLPSIEPSILTPLLVGGVALAGTASPAIIKAKALAGQGRLLVDMGQKERQQQNEPSSEPTFLEASLFGEEASGLDGGEGGLPDSAFDYTSDPISDEISGEVSGQARVDQGLAYFEEAIATNPNDPALYVERSLALAKLGDRQGAMADMEQAELLSPDHPIIQLYKGHVLMTLDQPSEALAAYEASLTLEEENPPAILAKATALNTLGHPEEAVLTFNQLIDQEAAPSTTLLTQAAALGLPLLGVNALKAQALNGKGNTLIGLGYTGAGLDNLKQAVNTDPTNAQLWVSQGNALQLVRQPDAAIASFERALELDPTSTEALLGKGNGLMLLNQKHEAQAYFDQAALLGDDLSGVVLPSEEDLSDADQGGSEKGSLLEGNNLEENGDDDRYPYTNLEESKPDSSSPDSSSPDSSSPDSSSPDSFNPISSNPDLTTTLGIGATGVASGMASQRAALPTIDSQSDPKLDQPQAESADPPLAVEDSPPKALSSPEDSTMRFSIADLADVDEGLPPLPEGYGESRIVLLPRDPKWAYAYWDVSNEHKQTLRQQGGTQLVLRLCDVTGLDLEHTNAHSMQQFDCDELARDWHLPIPVSDRDYVMEIGYVTPDERWLMLARSLPVRVPPVYPSDWTEEQFLSVTWDEPLAGQEKFRLESPDTISLGGPPKEEAIAVNLNHIQAMRQTGSLFGSMHQIPSQSLSSFTVASGAALGTMIPTPLSWGNFSGMGMSGANLSGVGFFASMPPIRARKFWLMADAELIVYGATEPDATVMIGDQPIALNRDGTFRFHMPFKDGVIDYPIVAVAADGEQTRSIHLSFERDTPHQNTNPKSDATDEWF